jgi:membrane protein implicated in regulation of membrane protease activity
MEPYLVWILVGLALVIVELVSGTFYLLVLGVGAFAAAAAAALGAPLLVEVAIAGVVAVAGAWMVRNWHKKNQHRPGEASSNAIDIGQTASFEAWIDQGKGLARVKYRGASWDAVVPGGATPQPNDLLYITGQEGHVFHVSATKP